MIETFPIGLLGSNIYLIYPQRNGPAAIIDPGLLDATPIYRELENHSLELRYILNTHGHFDHVAGNSLFEHTAAELAIHPDDQQLLVTGGGATRFGLDVTPSQEPDRLLVDGMIIELDNIMIEVIHTPGHTRGSVCFAIADDHQLITGDTLFAGGVGRTDLPGGNADVLHQSLKRILTLPSETRIYPGHGGTSTIEREKRVNPWLRSLPNRG